MDREQLKELKHDLQKHWESLQPWVKGNLDIIKKYDDIITSLQMIDGALAEPSDADVAVQDALQGIGEFLDYAADKGVEAYYAYNSLDKLRSALRQYQKPTDEAVQRAIEFWEQSIEEDRNIATQEYMDAMTLAIQALKRWVE